MRKILLLLFLLAPLTLLGQRYVKTFDSLAAMVAANPNDVHTVAAIKYTSANGDTDTGGIFYYDAASSAATNTTTVFKPNSYGGRWIRGNAAAAAAGSGLGDVLFPDFDSDQFSTNSSAPKITIHTNRVLLAGINIADAPYNAVGDGATDSTAAFQSAYNVLRTAGGGVIYVPRAANAYLLNLVITNDNIAIIGVGADVAGSSTNGVLRPFNTANPVLQIGNDTRLVSGTIIEDLAIIAERGGTNCPGAIHLLGGAAYSRISRVTALGGADTVKLLGGATFPCTLNSFEQSAFWEGTNRTIKATYPTAGSYTTGNSFTDCYINGHNTSGYTLELDRATPIRLVNCYLDMAANRGGYFTNGPTLWFQNCNFDNQAGAGLFTIDARPGTHTDLDLTRYLIGSGDLQGTVDFVDTGGTQTVTLPATGGFHFLSDRANLARPYLTVPIYINSVMHPSGRIFQIDMQSTNGPLVFSRFDNADARYDFFGTNSFFNFRAGNVATRAHVDFLGATNSLAELRIFRETSTTGNRLVTVFKGDGTATPQFQIDADSGNTTIGGTFAATNLNPGAASWPLGVTADFKLTTNSVLSVRDEDGTPNVAAVRTIRVSNGTLIDNGGGDVSITTGGGAGSGTNIYVDAAIITNPNFDSDTNILFVVRSSTNIVGVVTNVHSSQIIDGTIVDADVASSGITTRSKLPAAIAYEDEANVFTALQTINGSLVASNEVRAYTVTASNSVSVLGSGTATLDLGTAGIRFTDDGDGAWTWLGLGNGNDEDLTWNLDDTANQMVVSSSTGLTNISFTSIGLTSPGFTGALLGNASTATTATNLVVSDTTSPTAFFVFSEATSGPQPGKTDGGATFDATTGAASFTSVSEGVNAVPNATDHLGFFAATTSAQLAGVLSDEQGSSGGFVRAASPTVSGTWDYSGGTITNILNTAYDATAWNGSTRPATEDAVRDKIESLTGISTAWTDIGDATADTTIALAGFETDFTSTIDAAGEAVITISNTDADAANDNSILDLKHNDGADANVFYFRFIGDADGTPSNDYLASQTAFTVGSAITVSLGATTVTTLDTGQGANELFDMDQNVLTTSGVLFGSITNSGLTASQAVVTDANKALASVAYTGSGNVMRTRTGIQRSIWLDAGAAVASSTNGAATGTYVPTGADNLTVDVFDFDDTTAESVQWKLNFPDTWDLGTIKYRVYWTTTTGTGDLSWKLAAGAQSDDDAFGATLGSEIEVNDTRLADNDLHIAAISAAVTVGGTPALNDLVTVKLRRDPADAGDTKTGDARLLGIRLFYLESSTEPTAQ